MPDRRTLYIVRHAKSAPAEAGMDDFDRVLNERGRSDAKSMAERFAGRNEPVGILICSPAKRTLATAQAFAQALSIPAPVELPEYYLATSETLLSALNNLPGKVASAMIVGHNPGVSVLLDDLTGNGIGDMPTGAMARVDFDAENWQEVAFGTGRLVWSDTPRSA